MPRLVFAFSDAAGSYRTVGEEVIACDRGDYEHKTTEKTDILR